MTVTKPDRRVRRTRELLRGALLSLIIEKGYERVTVQDILDRADVGRSTFYAHYRDKEELLLSGFDESFAAFAATTEGTTDFLAPARVLFEHAEGHRELWKALVGKQGAEMVVRYLREHLNELIEPHLKAHVPTWNGDELRLTAAVVFTVNSLIGTLSWWTEHDVPYTAEEIFTLYKRLTTQGVKRSLA